MLIRFIAVLLFAAVSVGVGSVAWPKFTTQPRPLFLEKAYEIAKQTELGVKTADVLGVTDTGGNIPINLGTVAQNIVSDATTTIERKARIIIASQAVLQLMRQIESLEPSEQEEIRSMICSTGSAISR